MPVWFGAFRTTVGRPWLYWFTGSVILWLLLPVGLLDVIIDPKWHAPHWQCDSFGVVLMETYYSALPWAAVSMVLAAILAFPMARKRPGGTDIFALRLGSPRWNWIVSVPIALVCAFIAFDVLNHVWEAIIPQTITADCGGSAEPITVVRRRPAIQLLPLVELGIALWLLHLRALALTPKVSLAG